VYDYQSKVPISTLYDRGSHSNLAGLAEVGGQTQHNDYSAPNAGDIQCYDLPSYMGFEDGTHGSKSSSNNRNDDSSDKYKLLNQLGNNTNTEEESGG